LLVQITVMFSIHIYLVPYNWCMLPQRRDFETSEYVEYNNLYLWPTRTLTDRPTLQKEFQKFLSSLPFSWLIETFAAFKGCPTFATQNDPMDHDFNIVQVLKLDFSLHGGLGRGDMRRPHGSYNCTVLRRHYQAKKRLLLPRNRDSRLETCKVMFDTLYKEEKFSFSFKEKYAILVNLRLKIVYHPPFSREMKGMI
jgi:hypothetical protein